MSYSEYNEYTILVSLLWFCYTLNERNIVVIIEPYNRDIYNLNNLNNNRDIYAYLLLSSSSKAMQHMIALHFLIFACLKQ